MTQKFCELYRSKRLLDFVMYKIVGKLRDLKKLFQVQFILIQHKQFKYQCAYH